MFHINTLERLEELEEKDYGYISEINIVGCKCKVFPELIFEFFNLESLDVTANELEYIPDKFDKLPNLKELILNHNPITLLPKSISKCTKLNYLSFQHTEIEILPKWLEKLNKIEEISFSACKIKSIKYDITKTIAVNVTLDSYANINNLSEDCEYFQITYLSVPLTNLPINLKKIKLVCPLIDLCNIKVPFDCELIIKD
jgi:Leucine-rich repeat (LRR) protein